MNFKSVFTVSIIFVAFIGANVYLLMPHRIRDPVEQIVRRPMSYTSCDTLTGRSITNLFSSYIGYRGVLPSKLTIDFRNLLAAMWQRKFQMSGNDPAVVRAGRILMANYDPKTATHIRLYQYLERAGRERDSVNKGINWALVERIYFRSHDAVTKERKVRLLKNVTSTIDGKDLIAYALTEIMPSDNGAFNREFLDCLLRNAGKEYVESIPSLNDAHLSFGPYQLTEYAVFDVGGDRLGGASVPNRALPRALRIGGNLARLSGDEHLRAAYLNAFHNLGLLVKALDANELLVLEREWRRNEESLLAFIAVAHHGPNYAVNSGRDWLAHDARQPFAASTSGKYLAYAIKTSANYEALR